MRLLGCEDRIVEYNQEQCRVNAYDGNSSLIRSFPSKVGVSRALFKPGSHHKHARGPRERETLEDGRPREAGVAAVALFGQA